MQKCSLSSISLQKFQLRKNFLSQNIYKMPFRKFFFDKIKFFHKSTSEKTYNIITRAMSTSETPGYSWLNFFKLEYHRHLAPLLGPGPTVKQVMEVAYFNIRYEPFTSHQVKLIRMDEVQTFDVEIEGEWPIDENGYMNAQTALRHIGEHYQTYKFI